MYLDLELSARTNGDFRDGLWQRANRMQHCWDRAEQDSDQSEAYNDALYDFLEYCHFNPGFLLGHYYPKYPEDAPLSLVDYPVSFQLLNLQIGGFMVVRGSRQIGKSLTFAVRQHLNAHFIHGMRSLYLTPRNQQLETYANKFREVEEASILPKDSNCRNLRHYKEYPNRSVTELFYVLSSASAIRGKTVREVLLDECQDFDADLEIEVEQIQSATQHPMTIYAGTSLNTDTFLEAKWNISSQGSWLMKCGACNHWNIPLKEYGVLDMIQPAGPSCVKCGRLINVKAGKFVHAHPHLFQMGNRGYHIPQLVVPGVVYNPQRWAKIYDLKVRQGGNRKFFQEILGIATEEGERELTKQHLINICTLGRDIKALENKAINQKYKFVVSGCDWGGSEYNPAKHTKVSTTVHVMMGITPQKEFEIIHFDRWEGMNYEEICDAIIKTHKQFRGHSIATDTGVGMAYNSRIRYHIPVERHLQFTYVGPATALISAPAGRAEANYAFNTWSLNKTESISLTYDAIREKRIKCYAWELAEPYLSDCLNMYRAPAEKLSGASAFVYRPHASKPNDALQAINYAYMLGKLLLREPMFADMSLKLQLENALYSNFAGVNRGGRVVSI